MANDSAAARVLASIARESHVLAAYISALQLVRADIVGRSEKTLDLKYCIDFFDLYGFLIQPTGSITEGATEANRWGRTSTDDDDVTQYIRLLLFTRPPGDLTLLPQYLREFRRKLESTLRRLGQRGVLDQERVRAHVELALDDCVREYQQHVSDIIGRLLTLGNTSAPDYTVRAAEVVQAALVRCALLSERLTTAGQLWIAVARFERLLADKIIKPLDSLLDLQYVFPVQRDNAFEAARIFFESRRPTRGDANEADAWAVSNVNRMNEYMEPRSRVRFTLCSTAPLVQEYLAEVARPGRGTAHGVNARGKLYLGLYYGLVLSSQDNESLVKRVDALLMGLQRSLDALRVRYLRLQHEVEVAQEDVTRVLSPGIEAEVDQLLDRVRFDIRQVFHPILDERARASSLRDWLSVIDGVHRVDLSPIRKVETALRRIGAEADVHRIQGCVVELEQLSGEVEQIRTRIARHSAARDSSDGVAPADL